MRENYSGSPTPGDYTFLPDGLPKPEDDGAAQHLLQLAIPSVDLRSTSGGMINLSTLSGTTIVFCYPMMGQPGLPLPDNWDDIPGARGCTPQACAYRDNYLELMTKSHAVYGVSGQSTEIQSELRGRLDLPYELLSDAEFRLQKSINLPTFEVQGERYLKRVTLIIREGVIAAVHYPVFPSNLDTTWVLNQLN